MSAVKFLAHGDDEHRAEAEENAEYCAGLDDTVLNLPRILFLVHKRSKDAKTGLFRVCDIIYHGVLISSLFLIDVAVSNPLGRK